MYMYEPSLELEKGLWSDGFKKICGIDEVGRGPLAGPVVAGAVVIDCESQFLEGVRDSKVMSEKKRDFFCEKIKEVSLGWGIGVVESSEIDSLGLSRAIEKAMVLAVKNISCGIDFILIDGNVKNFSKIPTRSIVDGDRLHYSISAASVIAKVARDKIMREYALKYPQYGFEKHVGYGTKVHMEALKEFGPCEIHRKCFKPVAKFFGK